ncbi:RNA-binding S4 domain-containing protein [Amantichitinum ursilacus]|uniref:Ribosome-associated protein n=1 Tax=Amantichitinum ursilacus TaxID=857265 RepID=A0A0N0XJU8_9NEIS|nr:RNA-binding S4 domain-containing protein [Amantichitinum ursilacus]KPC52086.1 ribosome-associated protein [Amantichitinum ursilacus]
MQHLEVEIDSEFIALNDLLKICGLVDSGGAGKALVATGIVKVNGEQELRKTNKIRPGMQVQVADDVVIDVKAAPEE